jgi:hypothetical protein
MISQSAIDLIVKEEVSSQAYYTRHYQTPEWPGGASGVTVAIGYDLGYATVAKIKADWFGLVSVEMLQAMCECSGVEGIAAKALAKRMNNRISIPWDVAMKVFMNRDVPQWTAASEKALPNFDSLNPTCAGVLVSLNYNRGCGGYTMQGDRYLEMRAIKQAMIDKKFDAIPGLLDHMARLWPNSGVGGRRHREADLFRKGLTEPLNGVIRPKVEIDDAVILSNRPDQAARTKPPATTTTQNSTTAAIIGGATTGAVHFGLAGTQLVLAIVAAIVVGGGVWFAWYKNRNPS